MNIAVCEDIERDADLLCELLLKYANEHQLDIEISRYRSGDELFADYRAGKYHILFLDILMDGTNGMETAQKIRQLDDEVAIIFVTVSKEFAVDSYEVDAVFYLVKPLEYKGLTVALGRCESLLQQYARAILISEGRKISQIRLRDIIYLESQRNDCIIHTKSDEIRTRAKLCELERELGGLPFFRCHNSFIINMHWAMDMVYRAFILRDGITIPISRIYSKNAQEVFREYLISQARKTSQ